MTSKLLTTVAVALVVLAGIPAGSISAAAADSGPSGMSAVPDGNINVDVPDGQTPAIPAESLRGSTYTGSNASSMSVTVTTPNRAEDLVGSNANLIGAGDLALILSDDQHHAGREVALPAGAVHEAVGYTPKQVRGVHSSGSTWTREVSYENGYLVFEVPEFSENGITFTGEVQITASSATDGFKSVYDVSDKDAVKDFTADVTGITNTETDTESASSLADGNTLSLSVAGNLPPTGPSSNNEPEITFEGTEKTTSWSTSSTGATSGSTKSVTVPGNVDPDAETVEFTGTEQTTARTVSQTNLANGDSFSYSVGGNIPATDPSVTFIGDSSTTTDSVSANGASPSTSTTLSVGGNLDPTDGSGGDPTLSVTAHNGQATQNPMDTFGDGTADNNHGKIGDNNYLEYQKYRASTEIKPNKAGKIESLTFKIDSVSGSEYPTAADIYLDSGSVDTNIKEGTKIKSGWDINFQTGKQTVTLDNPPTVQADQTYEIEVITTNADDDGEYDYVSLAADTAPSSTRSCRISKGTEYCNSESIYVDYDMSTKITDLSASTDDGASANFGDFSDGEKKSQTIDLSTSSSNLDFSGSGGSIDYDLTWTERTATEDPSIDVDGDGSTDASYTGVLKSGETHTASVSNLSPGSYTADVSTGHQVDVDFDMTERTASEDPGLDLDGDGTTDASYSGILTSGETASVSADALSEGSTTLETSLTAGSVDYSVSADGRYYTEDPAVDVDGDGVTEAGYSGILAPGETATAELPSIDRQTSSVTISTAGGSVTTARVIYTERTETEDVNLYVNGNETSYAGRLGDGETTSLTTDSAWVREGTNNVTLGLTQQSADAPATQVQLTYRHEVQDKQTVTYTAEQLTSRYNVSKSFAGDRSAASLTIPFERNVYEVRNLEVRTNGGTWSDVAPADYTLTNTTLDVELGAVSAGDTVTVRADGSMARVNNGSIQVIEPSVRGSTLDSRVQLTDWAGNSYMRMPAGAERIHYAYNEPWAGEIGEYAIIGANGTQQLYLPPSDAGYEFQLSTVPVTATPANGDVQVSISDAPDTNEPTIEVGSGSSYGDEVEFTFVDAKDDQKYILYSTSQGVVRDSGTANSPLTLSDDDSDETLQFQEENTTASTSSSSDDILSGATMGPISAPEEGIPVPLIVGVVLLLALAVLVRRFEFIALPSSVPQGSLPAAAGVLVVFYIVDWASGHVITQSLGSGLQPLVPLAGLIGLALTAYYLYKTYIKGQGPRPIQIVANGASRVRDGSNRLRGGNN